MKKLSLIFFTLLIITGIFAPFTAKQVSHKVSFFVTTASAQTINQNTAVDIAKNGSQDYSIAAGNDGKGLSCNGSFFLQDIGCQIGVFLVFNIFYSGTSWLASITAGLADNLLWQSLQSWTYQNDFILNGWTAMRDIANISFIAGLLYAAFLLLSGNDGSGKKTVFMVIVLAIGINFSLFITRLMIDGGNILARSIYQNIEVVNISAANTFENDVGSKKQISAGLVQIMNPQRLLEDDETAETPTSTLADGNISIFLFLFIFAGIVNILMMFMFIKIGLSFLGRTVGLMILMIIAPLTVFSELLPVKDKLPMSYLSLSGWFKEVWQLVVMAPIYVFFIYLMILFFGRASEQFKIADADGTGDWIARLISVGMPIFMTYFMMKAATDMTKKYSGEIGYAVASAVGAVGGAVVGGAMMLTGMAAGRLIGDGVGSMLQKQGANAAASVQDRRLYQSALKKKQEGREGDMTDDEKKAHAKIEAIKAKTAGTRTKEEQRDLDRAMGTGIEGKKAMLQDESATKLMAMGSKLRNTNFDPRAAKMFGFEIGGFMTKQLQTTSGLGGYMGYGGVEEKRFATKGSYNQIMAKAVEKEQERIKDEAKVIDEAAKARERKLREEVEKNRSSSQNAEAEADQHSRIEGEENGRELTEEEEKKRAELEKRKATRDALDAKALSDEKKKRKQDLENKKKSKDGISTAEQNELDDLNAKQKDYNDSLSIYNKLDAKLKFSDKDMAEYARLSTLKKSISSIEKDIVSKKEEAKLLTGDGKKKKEAEISLLEKGIDSRKKEKEKLETQLKNGTYISQEYEEHKKDLDKVSKEVADKRMGLARKVAEIEKISNSDEREAARKTLQNSKEMIDLLHAEEKKLIQEIFIKAKKGIATDDEMKQLANIQSGAGKKNSQGEDNKELADKIIKEVPIVSATTKAVALTDTERRKKAELEEKRQLKTISSTEETLLLDLEKRNKMYREQQNYCFAEKSKSDLAALKQHGEDMARIKQQFIDKEISYITEAGATMGKNLMTGIVAGLATAATGGLAGVGFAASAGLGAFTGFGVRTALNVRDLASNINLELMHMHYDQSLQSRFRNMGGTPPPTK